jgi:replication factor C subunit 1
LGRKTAEKLVETHGGKLGKSITGKTNYVVVGNDAGPKKLEQIEQHEVETLDENALIELLECTSTP